MLSGSMLLVILEHVSALTLALEYKLYSKTTKSILLERLHESYTYFLTKKYNLIRNHNHIQKLYPFKDIILFTARVWVLKYSRNYNHIQKLYPFKKYNFIKNNNHIQKLHLLENIILFSRCMVLHVPQVSEHKVL